MPAGSAPDSFAIELVQKLDQGVVKRFLLLGPQRIQLHELEPGPEVVDTASDVLLVSQIHGTGRRSVGGC